MTLMPDSIDAASRGSRRLANAAMWSIAAMAAVVVYTQLARIAAFATYSLLPLERDTHLGASMEFFLFEVPKVLLLLVAVVFVVGVLRTYLTPERARRLLAGRREAGGNVLAAVFGVATPFCSCSAVPLFIGFVTAGVPLGVTLSFLISAPMVNEVALVLLFGLFGWRVAALYLGTGLAIAIVAGWTIGRLKLERRVEPWVYAMARGDTREELPPRWSERLAAGRVAVREIVGKVWPYVVLGIAVGAGIHGYVPTNFLASFMGRDAWWAVPLAVLLGVPMYSNAAAIIPVVQALLGKGAALGTVLAFMMSVIALSLPEIIILRKVLRPVLIATFVATVAVGILAVGVLFNAVL
ncbi:MAG: permease [Acidobacteria bacterium]|nr:permease [Acidobacteriota bacterium]